MPKTQAAINTLIGFAVIGVLAASPLFFLPVTQDFYDTNKWLLFVVMALLLLILWAVRTVITNVISISVSPASVGFGAIVIASLISVILASPNKTEALIAPYGASLFAAAMILFLLGSDVFGPKMKNALKNVWYIVVGLLSLIAIYQFFGVGKTMFPKVAFLTNDLWTPVGSTLSLVAVFAITIPLMIQDLVAAVRKKEDAGMALLFSVVLMVIAGTVVTIGKLLPVIGSTVLPLRDGWAMTLEVLKDPKRALFGVGAENFLYAFTSGRNTRLNAGPLWNVRFITNASLFLHIAATMGAVGIIAVLVFAKSLLPKKVITGSTIARIIGLLCILLIPPTITLIAALAVLILLTEPDDGKPIRVELPAAMRWVSGIIAVIAALVVVAAGYGVGKVYAAETVFFRSLTALSKNDGLNTYNLQIQAATMMGAVSRYHLAYSQTNLAIANAMATNAQSGESGKPVTLSDSDRQTISNLIQQSIREAKIAVNLAPENVAAWENLAGLYQSLVNVVADVDQWAIATYQRAIQLDPSNPSLRLGLGGVFLLRNDAENAIQQISLAVSLKPDWANAYYNLAYAYKIRKDYLRAAYSLQQTLNYLPQGSPDRAKAESELAEMRRQLTPAQIALLEGRQPTQEELQGGSQLTRPDQQPRPVITPKIELPPDSSPPATGSGEGSGQTEGAQTQVGPEEVNPTVQPQP